MSIYLSSQSLDKIKMPAPSQIAIATSAVNRLVKEEASYHKEIEQQKVRIAKLEQGGGDENAEYELKQEVCHGCVLCSVINKL